MGQTDVDTPGYLHNREMDGGPGLPRAFPEGWPCRLTPEPSLSSRDPHVSLYPCLSVRAAIARLSVPHSPSHAPFAVQKVLYTLCFSLDPPH